MITWRGRTHTRFDTLGASVQLSPSGWMLFWTADGKQRARGPFRCLEDAMDAWSSIRAELRRAA